MKKLNIYFLALFAILFSFSSCGEDSPIQDFTDDGYGYDFTKVLEVYTDNVIVPTYVDMKDKAWTLYDAVQTFSTSKTQEDLNAVCAAWRATRIPWEQSEACLYGPAETLDLDPSLDSWPLKKGDIDKIIASGSITMDKIMDPGVHGFHTIEYLIFSDGNPKVISSSPLSDNEIQYLIVATEYLRNDCIKLWAAWNGATGISAKDKAVIDTFDDFDPAEYNFAYNFKNAITSSGVDLVTMDDAIDNIVEGCSGIADEVAAQKIGAPRDLALDGKTDQAVLEVESWYSWNSIDDYANNIISIRNSYFGGLGKTASNKSQYSVSTFVASKNSALDSEITAAIEKAYKAINEGMQRPFRNNLTGDKVDAAIDACTDLQLSIEKIKTLRD
ncbi:MAG: hypothetical protein LBV43_02605 [Prevotella sp.]|jgi:hypothetical protein|nr:hypothetical protein [Prevotella sp.]